MTDTETLRNQDPRFYFDRVYSQTQVIDHLFALAKYYSSPEYDSVFQSQLDWLSQLNPTEFLKLVADEEVGSKWKIVTFDPRNQTKIHQ